MVWVSAYPVTSFSVPLEDVDLPVSVPLLLAAVVDVIIGTQYFLGFFFCSSNTELRFCSY